MNFFDNLTKYTTEMLILYIAFSILIFTICLFLFWAIIKSAVYSGTKAAIKDVLIETGITEQLGQERLIYYQEYQQQNNNIPQ